MILLQQVKVLQILLLNNEKRSAVIAALLFLYRLDFYLRFKFFQQLTKTTLSKPSVVFVLSVIHFS